MLTFSDFCAAEDDGSALSFNGPSTTVKSNGTVSAGVMHFIPGDGDAELLVVSPKESINTTTEATSTIEENKKNTGSTRKKTLSTIRAKTFTIAKNTSNEENENEKEQEQEQEHVMDHMQLQRFPTHIERSAAAYDFLCSREHVCECASV